MLKKLLPLLVKGNDAFTGLEKWKQWPNSKAHKSFVGCLHNQLKASNQPTLQGHIDRLKAAEAAVEEEEEPIDDDHEEEEKEPEDDPATKPPKTRS